MGDQFLTKKTRDCFGNRGFFEILEFRLEVPSHDAFAAGAAVPLGRQPHDALVANTNLNRGDHLITVGAINSRTRDLSSIC